MEDFLDSAAGLTIFLSPELRIIVDVVILSPWEDHLRVHAHPKNPDISQSANECSYRGFALPPSPKDPSYRTILYLSNRWEGVTRKRI